MNRLTQCAALLCAIVSCAAADASQPSTQSSLPLTSPASERTGADATTLDVTGIQSMDRLRSTNNVVVFLWVGPFNVVNGVGYDVFLQTLAPGSRLSDITMAVTNSAGLPGPSFGIKPGFGDDFSGGPTHYSRPLAKLPPGFSSVTALADGLIRLEFFDGFDEAQGEPDGLWVSGTVSLQTVNPIPAPISASAVVLLTFFSSSARHRRDNDRDGEHAWRP